MDELTFCLCTGRRYATTVLAQGAEATAWLAEFDRAREAGREASRSLLEELSSSAGGRPSALALTLRSAGQHAEVVARLDDRELVLSNARGAPRGREAWLRAATVEETFTLATRWLLGESRYGCSDPHEDAFWFHRAQFAAYAVSEPVATSGLSFIAMPPWAGVFVAAIEGTEEGALRTGIVEGLQEWAARNPESHAALGWFAGCGTSAVYQVAAAPEGTELRGGAT